MNNFKNKNVISSRYPASYIHMFIFKPSADKLIFIITK